MSTLFFTLLPDSVLILVPVILGFGIMLRIIPAGRAFSILGSLIIVILLTPFLSAIFDSLPLWILVIVIFFIGYSVLKAVSNSLFGKGVSDHLFGSILFSLFSLPFRMIALVFRMLLRVGERRQ